MEAFCPDCVDNLDRLPTDQLRRALFWPPVVPEPFAESHVLCGYCLDFYKFGGPLHRSSCPLEQSELALVTAGWATPFSIGLRSEIRKAGSQWISVASRILADLLSERNLEGHLVCPVPMSSEHGDGLQPVVRQLADQLGLQLIQAVRRNRQGSARQSGQTGRRRIAENEYQIDTDVELGDKRLILVDDNVTTGETMAGVARKLSLAGAVTVIPVSIDRTISTRFGQRLSELHPLGCSHKSGWLD